MELIQYEPRTETVYEIPILLSPPWINKYYVMDLAPGKSFAEWALDHGHTVFCISYRNPDESFRDVGFEDYLREGPLAGARRDPGDHRREAGERRRALPRRDARRRHARPPRAARRQGAARIRSATLLNALVDFSEPGALGNFVDPAHGRRGSSRGWRRRATSTASEMAGTFNLLRANDLIWRYVSANWLMGEDPPAFDILPVERRRDADAGADALRVPALDVPREPARRAAR